VYFSPDGHFDVILIGCLAGIWFASGRAETALDGTMARRVLPVLGVAVLALMLLLPYVASWRVVLGLLPLLGVGIAALILAVAVESSSPLALLLSLSPLVFVGKISYALYLWHPILLYGFGRLPTAALVVLSLVAATLSYYFVELPFLRRKRRDRERIDAGASPARAGEAAVVTT
jgi:peptidoglycan/LPS O-acetylase OafA/YrhL